MKYNHIFVMCLLLLGCDAPSQETAPTPEEPQNVVTTVEPDLEGIVTFDKPQDVLIVEPWVLVTNTSYRPATKSFGAGTVTVLHMETREVVNQLSLTQANPQQLLQSGDYIYTLCTGQTSFEDESWLNIAQSDGAIDRFPIATLNTSQNPDNSLALPTDPTSNLRGGFGSMALALDEKTLLISSGLSATLYRADISSMSLLNGPEKPIVPYTHEYNDTLTVSPHSDGDIRVASFNRDEVFFMDPAQNTLSENSGINLGKTDDLEGLLQILELPDGNELALFTISNQLILWNRTEKLLSDLAVVGPVANAMAVHGDFVYVVNSGVNNLVRINWKTGQVTDPFIVFPVGSNPWDIAISGDGQWAVVTLNLSDELAWIDLSTGELSERTR